LKEVKPTMFLGVPRVWEKVQEKMVEVGKTMPEWKKSGFRLGQRSWHGSKFG